MEAAKSKPAGGGSRDHRVTVAAIGTITGAVIVLGQRSITDIPTVLIALATLGTLWRFRVPEPILVGVAGLAGLVLHPLASQ